MRNVYTLVVQVEINILRKKGPLSSSLSILLILNDVPCDKLQHLK